MYEEPEEEPTEKAVGAQERALEKAGELRFHAEIAAVFEGPRKFDAQLKPGLDFSVARDVQQTMARLAKSQTGESPVIPETHAAEAARLLNLHQTASLSTNDYHIHRRPGEAMIIRWLQGEQVETFYERLQAHFDFMLNHLREEERTAHEWKQDPQTIAYLKALDALEVKMADRYLRPLIRHHGLYVLSTQTADEMNIVYLAEHVMGRTPQDLVGAASAPPDEPREKDLAWFYKLFLLRGMSGQTEQMCFFTYLQKTDDSDW